MFPYLIFWPLWPCLSTKNPCLGSLDNYPQGRVFLDYLLYIIYMCIFFVCWRKKTVLYCSIHLSSNCYIEIKVELYVALNISLRINLRLSWIRTMEFPVSGTCSNICRTAQSFLSLFPFSIRTTQKMFEEMAKSIVL